MKKKEIEGAIINEMEKLSKGFKKFVFWQKVKAWTAYISLPLLLISIGYSVYLSVHFKNEKKDIITRGATYFAQEITKIQGEKESITNTYNDLVNRYNTLLDSNKLLNGKANSWVELFEATKRYGNRHCFYLRDSDAISCVSY